MERPQVSDGRTIGPDIVGALAIEWAIGFAVCGFDYLCRLAVVRERLPSDAERRERVEKTFD